MGNQLTEKEDEYKKIKQYIINPIEIGLWEMVFTLIPQEDNSFISIINNVFQQSQQINNPINIITVLSNMYYINNNPMYQQYHNFTEEYKSYIKEFVEKYNIEMTQNYLTIDKEFIFPSENNHDSVKFLSLNRTLGENLEKIFTDLNYASLEKREKRFSPKAILFQPYFFYTQIVSNNLFSSTPEEFNYFTRASMSYNSGQQYQFNNNHQYEESIRIIGKAFESKLTHIYETLLRKDASHLSSIGKLLDSIKTEINNILENSQPKEYTLVSIGKEITKICQEQEKEKKENPNTIDNALNKFKKLAKEIKQKETEKKSKNNDNLLFPLQIKREINNVLQLRNQVSHHNTNQSTQEDVLNILFSYIQIYLWWQEASKSIQNWDGTKKEIIEEFEELKKESRIMKFHSFLKKPYISNVVLPLPTQWK